MYVLKIAASFAILLPALAATIRHAEETAAACVSDTVARSKLYAIPAATSAPGVQIGLFDTITVPKIGYAVLSPSGRMEQYFTLQSGMLAPYVNEYQKPMPLPITEGSSPTFVSMYPYPKGARGYCTWPNFAGSAPLLALNNRADAWALCANSTAGGRQDVVFKPIAGHPHYNVNACKSVKIEARPFA